MTKVWHVNVSYSDIVPMYLIWHCVRPNEFECRGLCHVLIFFFYFSLLYSLIWHLKRYISNISCKIFDFLWWKYDTFGLKQTEEIVLELFDTILFLILLLYDLVIYVKVKREFDVLDWEFHVFKVIEYHYFGYFNVNFYYSICFI